VPGLQGRKFKVIGLGGIGAPVAQALVQFLASRRVRAEVCLIDGDAYEESNRARVRFDICENKAVSKAGELDALAGGAVSVIPVARYVTPRNAGRLVENRDVVFLCVDNHATRRCVSDRCRRLDDVLLISGGNDGIEEGRSGTFGNVMVYERRGGRDCRTNPLTRFHPEIAQPGDRRPDQMSCAELARSTAPQLLFTNLAVAAAMLGTFYAWLRGRLSYEEVYLDILEARQTPVARMAGEKGMTVPKRAAAGD
jgi:hypothetical protein